MRRSLILLGFFVSVCVIYLGVSGLNVAASPSRPDQSGVVRAPLLAPTATGGVHVNATAIPASVNLQSMPSPRVLAWNPNSSQLAWYATGVDPSTIAVGSSGTALMVTCGVPIIGDKTVIYEGGTTAQPVLMPLTSGAPMPLGSNTGLSCSIPGHIQFSADGNRLGIIKYDLTIGNQGGNQVYATGPLRILKLPEGVEQTSIDSVTSFDLQNDGAVAVQFFTNTKNQAKTASVIFWDGTKTRQIEDNVQLLNTDPKADCAFLTAKVLRISDKVYTLYGEKCKQGGSSWRIRIADFAGGNARDIQSGTTGAGGNAAYFINSDTNDMWLMPGGKELLFTVPNGTTADVADVARLSIADGKLNNVMTGVIVNAYPPTRVSSPFQVSPKGDFLSLLTRNGVGAEQLFVYDMSAPAKPPHSVAGGGQLNHITGIAWAADDQHLLYTMTGDTQALFSYTVNGDSKVIARGTFQGLAVSADGSQIGVTEQIKVAANDLRYNLVAVKADDGTKTNLIEGAKGEQALNPLLVH